MRLAILSNGEPKMLKAAVQRTGIHELIDAIFSVDIVKIFKPSPRVYFQLQDALKIDFEMTLGSASQSVTVEAGAPLVNTESATVSTVIDRTFVEDLPLNGRSSRR